MIFELSHENLTTALQEYMDKRNILNGKDFTFLMKTSRKGEKTSRAIITTVDVVVTPAVVAPVVEAEISPQMELPFEDAPVAPVEAHITEPEVQQEVVEVKATPFKKLFAA
jgi:hypothetical protein